MKISFEVDARCILVAAGCGLVGLFALHAAYPGLFNFWPTSSQDLAAWVQAVGSIVAIFFVFWMANYQFNQQRKLAKDTSHSEFKKVMTGIFAFNKFVERGDFAERDLFFFRMHRALLEDYLLICRGIVFLDVGMGYSDLLLAVRATLIQLIAAFDEADCEDVETIGDKILISENAYSNFLIKVEKIMELNRRTIELVISKFNLDK